MSVVSASILFLLYSHYPDTRVYSHISMKLVYLTNNKIVTLPAFAQAGMEDTELLVCSALGLTLIPGTRLNWQTHCLGL